MNTTQQTEFVELGDKTAAYFAWCLADGKWQNELDRIFHTKSGDVRYTEKGKGVEGSKLRSLYDANKAAFAHYKTFI